MAKVKIQGHASGTGVITVTAPNTSTDRTITLPDTTGTLLDENSSVPAANLTGTVADARISTLTASKLTGALPAISGASLTSMSGPSFIAKLQTATGISNITWTKVPLNLEPYDSDGCYDNATNYRFTPTKAGYYKVYGSVRVTATKVRAMYTSIYKNGSNVALRYKDFYTDASSISHLSNDVSALIPFNGTSDYIELYIWAQQNSGALYIQNASDTQLSAHWVRSL